MVIPFPPFIYAHNIFVKPTCTTTLLLHLFFGEGCKPNGRPGPFTAVKHQHLSPCKDTGLKCVAGDNGHQWQQKAESDFQRISEQ